MNLFVPFLAFVALMALTSSGLSPGGVVHVNYAAYVGPAFVWAHGDVFETPHGCEGQLSAGASIDNPAHGPQRVVTQDRLPGCGHVRVWVYEEPMEGACGYRCQTGRDHPSIEEIRA